MGAPLVETRTANLTDLPMLRRLVEQAVTLDNEAAFTTDTRSTLSSILLPARGQVTMIARTPQMPVIGQLKLRYDDPNARVVYIAPTPHPETEDTLWLHVLDGIAREAGKLRAQTLVAEVAEDSPLFEILRAAGYAVYARQQLWHRQGMYSAMPSRFKLHEETQHDLTGVHALIGSCIPRLIQPFAIPPGDMPRLVYAPEGTALGYVAYSSGKRGVYILAYLHSDASSDASQILDAALQMIAPAPKTPITFCVRRFQDWLSAPMERLGFAPGQHQALMVKHLAAGVRPTQFEALADTIERVKANPSSTRQMNVS